nr:acylphosphatase [Kineosporia sp. A_224]
MTERPATPGAPVPKPGPHLAGALRRPPGQVDERVRTGRVRLQAFVSGTVQGVGFRWWTRSRALELGLVGTATNLADGRVEVVAEGPRQACEKLLELLSEQPPRDPPPRAPRSWYRRPGHVLDVEPDWRDAAGDLTGFREA